MPQTCKTTLALPNVLLDPRIQTTSDASSQTNLNPLPPTMTTTRLPHFLIFSPANVLPFSLCSFRLQVRSPSQGKRNCRLIQRVVSLALVSQWGGPTRIRPIPVQGEGEVGEGSTQRALGAFSSTIIWGYHIKRAHPLPSLNQWHLHRTR